MILQMLHICFYDIEIHLRNSNFSFIKKVLKKVAAQLNLSKSKNIYFQMITERKKSNNENQCTIVHCIKRMSNWKN